MWWYQVYCDVGGKFRWRLRADKGQTVATSGEAFASGSDAVRAAEDFKSHAAAWTYEVYADASGEYRWRAKGGNGQIAGSFGGSFASKANAEEAAANVRTNGGGAEGPRYVLSAAGAPGHGQP